MVLGNVTRLDAFCAPQFSVGLAIKQEVPSVRYQVRPDTALGGFMVRVVVLYDGLIVLPAVTVGLVAGAPPLTDTAYSSAKLEPVWLAWSELRMKVGVRVE